MPQWFSNRSTESRVKVELPSDWCCDKFRGFGTYVVFKCKNPFSTLKGYSVKHFNGAFVDENFLPSDFKDFLKRQVIGTQDSYMIWLSYTRDTWGWKNAKNFVTFSFFEENNEDVEVKECGVILICGEDIEQGIDLSMLQGLLTPTRHGGMLRLYNTPYWTIWSW
ncbi:hypothetical protein Tco_0110325 [Tanacetum coccineum]